MIISGYQGIGKSSLAGKNNCIDLESGNFWVDGKRADDWYKPYCQIANHLSQQGYTVFVSSHEVVRKELEKSEDTDYELPPEITGNSVSPVSPILDGTDSVVPPVVDDENNEVTTEASGNLK